MLPADSSRLWALVWYVTEAEHHLRHCYRHIRHFEPGAVLGADVEAAAERRKLPAVGKPARLGTSVRLLILLRTT